MHMHESSGFPPTIERRRERESEREIFNDACCVDFVEEMEVFDCVLKGLINICFAPK